MTLISTDTLAVWRTRARRSSLAKLRSLLEFRELVPEFKAEGVLMQAYGEAAENMLMASETLRDYMGRIREYPAEKLTHWLSGGLSFDHLATANRLAEAAHKTPEQLLDEALDPGNANGGPMTVDELATFATGELPHSDRARTYRIVLMFDKLQKAIYQVSWDASKQTRFTDWWSAGEEFRS
jgi:hypothetical protein